MSLPLVRKKVFRICNGRCVKRPPLSPLHRPSENIIIQNALTRSRLQLASSVVSRANVKVADAGGQEKSEPVPVRHRPRVLGRNPAGRRPAALACDAESRLPARRLFFIFFFLCNCGYDMTSNITLITYYHRQHCERQII